MHAIRVLCVLMAATVLSTGCKREKPPEPVAEAKKDPPKPTPTPVTPVVPNPIKTVGTIGAVELVQAQSILKGVGTAVAGYFAEHGKLPTKPADLDVGLDQGPVRDAIRPGGFVTFIWGAATPENRAETVLAYETTVGNRPRIVVMADGQIRTMDFQTFEQATKAKKK